MRASARLALRLSALAALLVAPHGAAGAQGSYPPATGFPMSRDTIVGRIADLQRIHTPEGIEELEALEVNGSRQWISIRGLNRANPILLVVHGGPGSAMLASTWAYQKPWEDFFTVVNWDQRGVGKNWNPADTGALRPTMTAAQHVRDAEVVVRHVLKKLGQQKLVLLGWSWGTSFTPALVQQHPELFHAWVGMGVAGGGGAAGAAPGRDPLHERLMDIARAAADTQAVRELTALAPGAPGGPRGIDRALALRKWARIYDGGWYGKPTLDLFFKLSDWGPEYTAREAEALVPSTQWGARAITGGPGAGAPSLRYEVPMFFLMGRYDLHTLYAGAQAHFARIEAPLKKFITFERSAHFVMVEEPGRFLMTLVTEVLPLAGGAKAFEVREVPIRR
ncbi:MAG: alpha/beta hydrolase [Gemmatimonadetes bacterium]|nr:alpha/beta hydrolase [Gemmatimonadota bacterium]